MRVLGIVTAWPRHSGDVITPWLQSMALALAPLGVTFEVMAPSWRGAAGGVHEGIRVHRFRYAWSALETLSHDLTVPDQLKREPWRLALLPGYLAGATRAVTTLLRRERFDVVHAFWPFPHAAPAWASGLLTGVPFVSSFFGAELALAERVPGGRRVVRELVKRSAAVTTVSRFTAARLRAMAPDVEPVVIPFGSTILPTERRVATPRGSSLRAVFIGRLVERKGVSVLLSALEQLRDVELEVLGDGPLRAELERQARSLGARVTFRGFVDDDEKRRALERAHVLVLPAIVDASGDTEGQGVVLLEAMALGRAVIASEVGGITDMVTPANGLLVPPGDVSALSTALARLRDDAALRDSLGEAGLQHVRENFSWSALAERVRAVYRVACA
ncbi:MAG: hypothetical protein DI536_27755 [Archangium gephyra]|uniref:Glycosyltransferase subfamily 4-like N-terminal domain-containing protein n=1 Tax=Archangium gephyra TaxID=48 RepID=A0A2W5SWR4_9BACT|nr:MAG: hypothetical protein DI536_27755 [Archangium gephyra]